MKKCIRNVCIAASMLQLISSAHAGVVVNYYNSIGTFVSDNTVPAGNFVQDLEFQGSIDVAISGTTQVTVVYADNCSLSDSGTWNRYIIFPASVTDSNSGNLTATFIAPPAFQYTYSGMVYYAYLIDSPSGSPHSCTLNVSEGMPILSGGRNVTSQVSLQASDPMNIVVDDYVFNIPVRAFAVLNSSDYNVWIEDVLQQSTSLYAKFTVPIRNFCEIVNKDGYTFDFGSITEQAANAAPFAQVPSDPMDLDITCITNASIALSFAATESYQGTANYVSMGTDTFYADFHINGVSQSTLTQSGSNIYSFPLQAFLNRSSVATDIVAGVYTGSGNLRVTIE